MYHSYFEKYMSLPGAGILLSSPAGMFTFLLFFNSWIHNLDKYQYKGM